MTLSTEQQAMADGKYGKGTAMAMEILMAIGEGFEAKRMVPIKRAHVSLSAQEADVWFAEKLYKAGAGCRISPTVNPGYSLDYFCSQELLDQKAVENMMRTEQVYKQLGAQLTYSCTPYLFGNIPHYGEVVSFSETSATIYVNSVLGAKTNRESAASALCAAVTGFVPEIWDAASGKEICRCFGGGKGFCAIRFHLFTFRSDGEKNRQGNSCF